MVCSAQSLQARNKYAMGRLPIRIATLFRYQKTVFLSLLFFDFVLVVVHLIFGKDNSFFHLDFEVNLPTLYQSLKLIAFACWLRYFQAKIKTNLSIIFASCALLFIVLYSELLSSTGLYEQPAYLFLVTVEEVAEMFFATMLIHIGLRVIGSKNLRLKADTAEN